jgi:hypothetical protein
MTIATLPLAFVSTDTSYDLIVPALVIRGVGFGCTMMPAIAAAYSALRPDQVPGASSALNAVQRVGGSVGTALLSVVLQHGLSSASSTAAFGATFAVVVGMTAVAAIPAGLLAIAERGSFGGRAPTVDAVPG